MKLYRLQSFNGFDGLTLQEGDISSPGPREVLIQVQATSLNYRDIAIARGEYGGYWQRSSRIRRRGSCNSYFPSELAWRADAAARCSWRSWRQPRWDAGSGGSAQ